MKTALRYVLLSCLSLGFAGWCWARHVARADIVERVVATVNDDAILLSELRFRAAPFLPGLVQNNDESSRLQELQQLYRQILEQLIDDELLRQAAQRMQVTVTAAEVQRAIDTVRQQNRLQEAEFWRVVGEQGFSQAGYRADVRRQLLRLKVVNQRVRTRVNISEEDVRRAYDERARKTNRQYRFRASHIFFPVAMEATATEVAQVRRQAQQVRASVNAQNFAQEAQRLGGGELGWLKQGDLPAPLEQVLLALDPGQCSDTVRGPQGFHILLLHEREQGEGQAQKYEQQKEEIQRSLLEAAMTKQEKAFLEELRRGATISKRL